MSGKGVGMFAVSLIRLKHLNVYIYQVEKEKFANALKKHEEHLTRLKHSIANALNVVYECVFYVKKCHRTNRSRFFSMFFRDTQRVKCANKR